MYGELLTPVCFRSGRSNRCIGAVSTPWNTSELYAYGEDAPAEVHELSPQPRYYNWLQNMRVQKLYLKCGFQPYDEGDRRMESEDVEDESFDTVSGS